MPAAQEEETSRVIGDIRRLGSLLEEELFTAAKEVGAPFEAS